ncbi:U6 snRNA m6A methyltransferase [Paragonimus westermani]|uniref:U6 snRNA m6A methyltransferase n=1 Tax=Paragonimus westermani TaxID=34504 RepID=A0A5J4NP72_9TREM|nr:U6 snRNA m6A methyltransferase [Paragonimus westermani]
MALNKYMHPRNIYRSRKPQFKQLAQKYPFFKDVIQEDEEGRISLDFKVPSHLAALSKALLLNDFGLDLEFPLDRLVPTVPLRLNYILWLEDIIQSFHPPGTPVTVLDVGVGASCIYPLLGAKKNGWRFVGTEIDARNYAVAVESVARNSLQHLVQRYFLTSNSFDDRECLHTSPPSLHSFLVCISSEESEFRRLRKFERPPLTLVLPSHLSCLPSYTVEALLDWLRAEFKQLKMKCIDQKNRAEIGGVHLSICATENTWTHSRRKRREAERLARSQLSDTSVNSDTHLAEPGAESESKQNDGTQLSYVDPPSANLKRPHMENPAERNGCISSKTSLTGVDTSTETKRPRIQEICGEGEAWADDFLPSILHVGAYCSDVSVSPIIRADIFVEQRAHDELEPAVDQPELDDDEDAVLRNLEPTGPLVIKIEFVEGSCREAANQILCYLKNRLS